MDFKNTFKVFGLGQCGTRLTLEFQKMGCEVCFINSDSGDVAGISSKNILQLDVSGTGGSPIKGREMVQKNRKDFEAFIKKNACNHRINLVIAGAGGGTGGGIVAPTLEIIKFLGYKAGCLITLPPKVQGILASDNAVRTLKEVRGVDLDLFAIADNDFLMKKYGIGSDWWKPVNQHIVYTMLSPYTIVGDGKVSKTGFGSIDKGEVNRIMQYGQGLVDVRTFSLSKKEIDKMDDKALKAKLFEPNLVEGYEYKYSLAYMVNIDTPEKADVNDFSNRVFQIAQKAAGSAVARVGTFACKDLKDTVRITIVNSGLKLPKVLQSRMNNLKRDSQRFSDKKNKGESIDLNFDGSVIDQDFDIN